MQVNSDSREDQGVVRYGSVVSIKAPAAKDRFLSVRDGRIGFWRSLIGKAEKWVILKAFSAKGIENAAFDGAPICIGDTTFLLSQSTDMRLSMVSKCIAWLYKFKINENMLLSVSSIVRRHHGTRGTTRGSGA